MDYLHRGFTHPGGVSPMKQEEQEVTKNPKSKQEEAIDPNIVKFVNQYGPKTDESGMQGKTELSQGPDINEKIVNAITRFIAPQNTLEAGLAILPFGIGKHPGVKKLASKIFGGGTGKVIKGGVDKTTGLTQATKEAQKTIKEKVKSFNFGDTQKIYKPPPPTAKELAKREARYVEDFVPRHNKAIDEFNRYRHNKKIDAGWKGQNRQYFETDKSAMDWLSFEERLKYLSKHRIKDDRFFRGGITKKGKKYFDVDGVEIPLDPKTNYVPPSLRIE
jgi:hypothetical protein